MPKRDAFDGSICPRLLASLEIQLLLLPAACCLLLPAVVTEFHVKLRSRGVELDAMRDGCLGLSSSVLEGNGLHVRTYFKQMLLVLEKF